MLTWLLSLIIFLPTFGAFVLCLAYRATDQVVRRFTLATTVAVFLLTLWLAIPTNSKPPAMGRFDLGTSGGMQNVVCHEWIPSFDIHYFLGIDGISLPLVLLTSFLSVLAAWASWPIAKHVRAYCILFLLLETGMLGVFLSLDFFLFYVFWEVMLLPMYFLIGIWGGPRREYAAIKFFLFTLVGSVLMLVAILHALLQERPARLDAREAGEVFDRIRLAAGGEDSPPGVCRNIRSTSWPWRRWGNCPSSPFHEPGDPSCGANRPRGGRSCCC